jgi:hypothetical protein
VPRYELFGLTIESDFPLPAPAAAEGPPDVVVGSSGARPTPTEAPAGAILADAHFGTTRYFTVRGDEGYTIRFPDVCDVRIDRYLRHVELVPATEELRPLSRVLFSGHVLATMLTLSGECVLHASAIEHEGRALAFVGPPGAGKSTLAALLCANGTRLVTDDVLRLVEGTGGLDCEPGTSELRLRPAAASLATEVSGTKQEMADGRTGVLIEERGGRVRLGAIVFPKPSRAADSLRIVRLSAPDCLMELTKYPRTLGWMAPEVLERSFRWNSRIAREVAAFETVVPWGPPFDREIPQGILSLLHDEGEGA